LYSIVEEALWNALLFKCFVAFYGGQLGFFEFSSTWWVKSWVVKVV
jgi:hypothetical protein